MEPTAIGLEVDGAVYLRTSETFEKQPMYQKVGAEDHPPFVRSRSGKLYQLKKKVIPQWQKNRSVGPIDTKEAPEVRFFSDAVLNTFKGKKSEEEKSTSTGSSGRCWQKINCKAVLTGLCHAGCQGVLITAKGLFIAATAIVGHMAYTQRTIVHFVPKVVPAIINGVQTTTPNTFDPVALYNASCTYDTPSGRYCTYEERYLSWPHAAAALGMSCLALVFVKQAVTGVHNWLCHTKKKV